MRKLLKWLASLAVIALLLAGLVWAGIDIAAKRADREAVALWRAQSLPDGRGISIDFRA